MARASMPLHTAKDRLAEARERFLAAEPVDPNAVRKPILASWWRSRQWHVAADHIELDYLRDPDLESNLARTADPVLRHLHEQLDGQPISIILTDAAGLVLTRMTADHDLERHLDGVKLAPGFSYAEERVGTNGIGTALESGGPAHVFGHEHYAEHLERFGLRRGADPRPGLGQDGRRDRPDLLAQERRPAAGLAGEVDGRPDHPGPAGRGQQP